MRSSLVLSQTIGGLVESVIQPSPNTLRVQTSCSCAGADSAAAEVRSTVLGSIRPFLLFMHAY